MRFPLVLSKRWKTGFGLILGWARVQIQVALMRQQYVWGWGWEAPGTVLISVEGKINDQLLKYLYFFHLYLSVNERRASVPTHKRVHSATLTPGKSNTLPRNLGSKSHSTNNTPVRVPQTPPGLKRTPLVTNNVLLLICFTYYFTLLPINIFIWKHRALIFNYSFYT